MIPLSLTAGILTIGLSSVTITPKPAPAPAPTAAPAPAPTGPRLPFPNPVAITVSDQTRYSSGVVTAVDPSGKKFDIHTSGGTLTCQFAEWSRIIGADGKPAQPAAIKVGNAVRVYYVTGHGAQLQEVDLIATH